MLIARPSDTDNVFVGFDQSLYEFAIGFTDSHAGLSEIVVKDGEDFTLNVHGNVEASYYFGDGTQLIGVALGTDLTSNASRVGVLETDLTSNASRVGVLETDLTSNASRVGVLETDLTSNASRVGVLETDLTSNASRVGVLETDLTSNTSRVGVLETDLTSNASRVGVLETDLTSNASRVGVLETDLTSNASRVGVLETDLTSNTSRVGVLETDLTSNTSRVGVLETDLTSNASRVGVLETDLTSNTSRISTLETKTTDISYTNGTTRISGNLTVLGNTTTLDTVNLIVQDPILQLSNASASVDSGILIARPSDTDNVFVGFDQSLSEFAIGFTDSHAGLNEIVVKDGEDFTLNVHGNVEASYYFGDGIGIGTTDPAYPLDVNGIVNAISFRAGGVISNFTITVSNPGLGNRYYIDGARHATDYGQHTITLYRGATYRFDQSDSSNNSHPFRLSTTNNGTHASGSQYTDGWTTTPSGLSYNPGNSGAFGQFVVPIDAPSTLYYYCSSHSGMGGTINILSGSVNTDGIVASNVSIQNNMGIGITNPTTPLHVVGNANITGGLRADGSTGSSGEVLTSSGGGAMTWTTPSSFSGDIAEYITHTSDL